MRACGGRRSAWRGRLRRRLAGSRRGALPFGRPLVTQGRNLNARLAGDSSRRKGPEHIVRPRVRMRGGVKVRFGRQLGQKAQSLRLSCAGPHRRKDKSFRSEPYLKIGEERKEERIEAKVSEKRGGLRLLVRSTQVSKALLGFRNGATPPLGSQRQ